MSKLLQYFGRIAVISLSHQGERRARVLRNLEETGLASSEDVTWMDAVDGRVEKPPEWWDEGEGAWGCRQSHLEVVRAAQRDGIESVLILEDDVVFHQRAGEWLSTIILRVPSDWDLFYLGGQHWEKPEATDDAMILKGKSIHRAHAYVIHRRAFSSFIEIVGGRADREERPLWHIDHVLGEGHKKGVWNAYGPAWWLAGQEDGMSNIAISHHFLRRWWQPGSDYWKLPFVNYEGESEHLHRAVGPVPESRMQLAIWLRTIAQEAWLQGRLPACGVLPSLLNSLWPSGVTLVTSPAELAELADYPCNGLFNHPFYSLTQTTIEP